MEELAQLVGPDTLRKWFRMLVKEKWAFDSGNRKGRPPIDRETEELIVKLLKENPSWGSDQVVGALKILGIKVSDTTIDNVRQRHGIPSAPEREKKVNWSKFLSARWRGLLAADFFTKEVVVPIRTSDLLHAIRDRAEESNSSYLRKHAESQRRMDETDRTKLGRL